MQLFEAALHGFCSQGYVYLNVDDVSIVVEAVIVAAQNGRRALREQVIVSAPPGSKRLQVNITKVRIHRRARTDPIIGAGVSVILVMPEILPPIIKNRAFPERCASIRWIGRFVDNCIRSKLWGSVFEGLRRA